MRFYLDSSVALHALQPDGDPRAAGWLRSAAAQSADVISSSLLGLEMARAFRRDGLSPGRAELLRPVVTFVDIDRDILAAAAAIEPHVKSLDAIHLATCLRLGSPTLVTHDRGMLAAATDLGIETYDPLAA